MSTKIDSSHCTTALRGGGLVKLLAVGVATDYFQGQMMCCGRNAITSNWTHFYKKLQIAKG